MRGYLFAALGAVLLAGCQSNQSNPNYSKTITWLTESRGMSSEQAKLVANNKTLLGQELLDSQNESRDDHACRSMGAIPGTQAYIQCRNARYVGRPRVTQSQPQPQTQPTKCVSREIYGGYRTTCY